MFLGIDGYRGILNAEWHLMQLLGQGATGRTITDQRTPSLAPISLLNTLHAECGRTKQGSLTGVVVTEPEGEDQLLP